jgi:hypothetical protein
VRTLRYIALEVVFAVSVIVVAVVRPFDTMQWWVVAFLPFAVMRLAVTFSENEVMAWLRKPFCDTVPDSCGAGMSVVAKHDSVMGALLSCPICTGVWCAMVLVAMYALVPGVGTAAIVIFGAAGGSELLYFAREKLSWEGRYARVKDGEREKRQNCEQEVEGELDSRMRGTIYPLVKRSETKRDASERWSNIP